MGGLTGKTTEKAKIRKKKKEIGLLKNLKPTGWRM